MNRTSITREEQKIIFQKLRKKGKFVFWGYIGCALWKPLFNPKFKVGDKIYFFLGKTGIPKERQTLETVETIGFGKVFGFYNEGYYIKILTLFLNKKERIKPKEKYHGLHQNWVENGEYIFNKLNIWSVS